MALATSVAVYAVVSIAMHQPFHAGGLRLRFFDLRVYRAGASSLVHGAPVYGTAMYHGLGFTYPPFADFVLAPLAWFSASTDALLVTALNIGLLVFAMRRALLLMGSAADGSRRHLSSADAWSLAAGLAGAALWLEPVSVTLGYGQINLLITALVVFDLSRPDRTRTKGMAIGLAAAIKLTPLLFIAYLLFSRRTRAAGVAALTFLITIALSFALATRDAATYWLHDIFQTGRIGGPLFAGDQSLRGLITRFAGTAHPASGTELIVVAVALAGLALAVGASRRGDEMAGYSLAALTTLLVSPISWSHHWALVVPALALLACRARERRSIWLGAAALGLALVGYAYLPELAETHFADAHGVASLALTDPYPVAALAVLAGYAVARSLGRRHTPVLTAARPTPHRPATPPTRRRPRTAAAVVGHAASRMP